MKDARLITYGVSLLALCAYACAGFHLEETLRIEVNGGRCLGPAWTDERGTTHFLVGTKNRVLILSDGQVEWQSDSLSGWVTALDLIDFGMGDGVEIVASTAEDSTATLHVFGGNGFGTHIQRNVFQFVVNWQVEYFNPCFIKFIDHIMPDTTKSIYFGNRSLYHRVPEGLDILSGRLYFYSLIEDTVIDSSQSVITGSVEDLKIIDTNNDGELELAIGWGERSSYGAHMEYYYNGCGISIYDRSLTLLNRFSLASYESQSPYIPSTWFYKLQGIDIQDGQGFLLYGAYDDSGLTHLAKIDPVRSRVLDVLNLGANLVATSMPIYMRSEDDVLNFYLLLIPRNGVITSVLLNSFISTDTSDITLADHYQSITGDFDGDSQLELACLTDSALTIFDVGPLSLNENYGSGVVALTPRIMSVYPNPFNSRQMIKYLLPPTKQAIFTITDIFGRSIVHQDLSGHSLGEHQFVWSASGLPSGTYLIRLEGAHGDAVTTVQVVR